MVMSACPDATGATRTAMLAALSPRSASMNNSSRARPQAPGSRRSRAAAASAPDAMAAALPLLRRCRTTTAPASAANWAVASELPSSTTITWSTPAIRFTAHTVAVIRTASSFAAMIATTEVTAVGSMMSGISAG